MKGNWVLVEGVQLAEREIEVLSLVAQGLTNTEIGTKISLSPKTIEKMLGKTDPRSIYSKIGVNNRSQATAWYVDRFGVPVSQVDKQEDDDTDQGNHWLGVEVTTPYLLDVAGDFSLKLRDFSEGGNPQAALSSAASLSKRLRRLLKDPGFRGNTAPFYKVLARVMFEQVMASKLVVSPDTALVASWPTVKELLSIAKECRDPEIVGLAYSCWADSHYITGHYSKALRWYRKALNLIITDAEERLGLLRGCSLAYAYLNQEVEYTRVKKIAEQHILEEGQVRADVVCHVLEGLGRAEGLLQMASAMETLYRGRDYYARAQGEIGRRLIRAVQLDRSELEILVHTDASAKILLERLGTSALTRAEEYGYARHAVKVKKLLETHLA